MNVLFLLFLLSLTVGQLISIPVGPGVFLYAHDFVLALFLVVGFGLVLQKKRLNKPKLLLPIAGFIGISIVSLLLNLPQFGLVGTLQSSLYLVRWMMYAALYVLFTQQIIDGDMVTWGLYGYGTLLCLFGVIQFFLYPDLRLLMYLGWDPHFYRLFSTLFDPNFAGILICVTMFLGVWIYEKKHYWWLAVALFLNGISLYLTYSRSSYLAFVAGFIVWILFYKKWTVGIVSIVIGILILLVPTPGGKTLSLFRADSTFARVGNWQESVGIIASSPIIGHGFDTLRFLTSKSSASGGNTFISHAAAGLDSSLLFVWATSGIMGLVVYLWFIYEIVKTYWKRTWLVTAAIAALVTHSIFVNSLFYAWVMLWVWMLLGTFESRR